MTGSTIVKLVVAGIFFGLWPLVMKKSGFEPSVQTFLLSFGTTIVVFPWFAGSGGIANFPKILSISFGFAAAAFAMNAIGCIAYLKGLGDIRPQEASGGVLIAILTMVVSNEAAGVLLFGSPVTAKKLLGFGSAIVTFLLLAL